MIEKFVDRFMAGKADLTRALSEKHPEGYKDLVVAVVRVLAGDDGYGEPDPERVHEINDGDYQGTLVYVIAAQGYQPYDYWHVRVSYGSCSGCDTLEGIREYGDGPPNEKQVEEYMTLALHIVQGLKGMGGETC